VTSFAVFCLIPGPYSCTHVVCISQGVYTLPRKALNGRVSMSQASKVVPFRGRNGSAPNTLNGKVPPPRRKNSEVRSREHLTPDEVEQLINAAKSVGRHGHRDATLILMAYRHGLRVSELVAIRWDMVDLKQGLLHVSRLKNGVTSTHPLRGPELRALRKLPPWG